MVFTVAITHESTKNSLGFRLSDSLFRIILTGNNASWFPNQACSLHCFLLTGFLQDAPSEYFWGWLNHEKFRGLTQDGFQHHR